MSRNLTVLVLLLTIAGCGSETDKGLQFSAKGRTVPSFSSDSAYQFIQKQIDFGPRVPNTIGHLETRKFLESKLRSYAGSNSVFAQEFKKPSYEGKQLEMANVIAAFNTSAVDRIMLAAHWDTRPRADEDTVRVEDYIAGADDGGSGVGVLLELARIFSENPPPIGIDIVLFDGEDYGTKGDINNYFLGSRHWSLNPPVPGYAPRFGILLDMVGAENAKFPKELYSMAYAPNLVNELWEIADQKGYADYFLNEDGVAIQDDHKIVYENTEIPFIDIIHHYNTGSSDDSVFPKHWHTHQDDMPIISKETLKTVGEILLELIYNRI